MPATYTLNAGPETEHTYGKTFATSLHISETEAMAHVEFHQLCGHDAYYQREPLAGIYKVFVRQKPAA